jgi:hypothetical protein
MRRNPPGKASAQAERSGQNLSRQKSPGQPRSMRLCRSTWRCGLAAWPQARQAGLQACMKMNRLPKVITVWPIQCLIKGCQKTLVGFTAGPRPVSAAAYLLLLPTASQISTTVLITLTIVRTSRQSNRRHAATSTVITSPSASTGDAVLAVTAFSISAW